MELRRGVGVDRKLDLELLLVGVVADNRPDREVVRPMLKELPDAVSQRLKLIGGGGATGPLVGDDLKFHAELGALAREEAPQEVTRG